MAIEERAAHEAEQQAPAETGEQSAGTGTPEPGGLLSRELLEILRGIRNLHIVGADIVEVSPEYDHADITAVAAANLVYELLSILTPRGHA